MFKNLSFLFGFFLSIFFFSNVVCAAPFGYEQIVEKAKKLSEQDWQEETLKLPKELSEMDYDSFRQVRYVREQGPWFGKNIPFEIQFFHMGSIFKNAVRINEIVAGKEQYIPYNSKAFTNNNQIMSSFSEDIDYAGFRLHYPLNTPDYYDELITFLGASYFRALGRNQKYGLSARGLAIDTGLQTGEEFPVFKEFWIKKPVQRDRLLTLYALLDSPRMAGAYSFVVRPGKTTQMDITATLFPRENIQKLGIAPLTSMYLFGENTKNKFFDYRPEVHDSDGLLVFNDAGEWLWRPLDNARQLRMSSFVDNDVKGFGLFQRDREATHYQDFEAYYQDRPSVWVEPLEGFGSGKVHLVEIPSDKEIHDNVVAFFWPDTPIEKGKKYVFKYRLNWTSDIAPQTNELGHVIATRTGAGGVSGNPSETFVKFVIDFDGGILDALKETTEINPKVHASSGYLKDIVVQKNPLNGGYRLFFDYKPDGKTAELRASLQITDKAGKETSLTEVWTYQFLP